MRLQQAWPRSEALHASYGITACWTSRMLMRLRTCALTDELQYEGQISSCRVSNGTEEPITAGDANRPLAAQDALRQSAPAGAARNGSSRSAAAPQHADDDRRASSTGAGVSGRPDHVTCRLVIDCMVRPHVPPSSSNQMRRRCTSSAVSQNQPCDISACCSCHHQYFSSIIDREAYAVSGPLEPYSEANERVQQARRDVLGRGLLCKRLCPRTEQVSSLHVA